ncbi:MAG: site-specific DNA-methyltransferase [Alphaproteobacteria bacterium]|nr:site-specific DNA-methyltransferase [Alphaproteobacteria bacterium]
MQLNKIYKLDVFDYLDNEVQNDSVDLAVVDPPYNMNKADWDSFDNHDAFLEFTYRWISKLIPKLKANSSLYIFNTPFNCSYILSFLINSGMDYRNWITWNKQDGISAPKTKFVNGSESILFFTKGNPTFNFDDIREPYKSTERILYAQKKGILKNGKRWFPNPKGALCGDVWDFSSQRHKQKINGKTQKLLHLTPKPIALIERIIKASSNEGDIVLDCFMGSGTTAMASINLNREYIGCEYNDDYYKLCMDNISKHLLIQS